MKRVSIVGSSGSGKTTLAKAVSVRLDVPHLELDEVYHQPNWQPLPDDEFQAAVQPLVKQAAWVIDGNYKSTGVQDLIWRRADTVIWLDLSRATTMWRVTSRSIRRGLTRQELWNGNRESLLRLFHPNPEVNIVAWTWSRYRGTRERYEVASMADTWSHLAWIHLTSPREIDEFVSSLES
jgi:adenylate kinase family enzyme